MQKRFVAVAIFFCLSLAGAARAAVTCTAANTITSLPFVRTSGSGLYCLGADLTCTGSTCPTAAIDISAPGPVTIDLGGFSITCTSGCGSNRGIYLHGGRSNVRLRQQQHVPGDGDRRNRHPVQWQRLLHHRQQQPVHQRRLRDQLRLRRLGREQLLTRG
jgi:hypothetical protein